MTTASINKYKEILSNGGKITGGILYTQDQIKKIKEAKEQVEYFDMLQMVKKIQLNSLYGALLAKGFRYSKQSIGASVTYTSRAITKYMTGKVGEILTGKFVDLEKSHDIDPKGEISNIYKSPDPVIIYNDTDSCYFKTLADNKQDSVEIADAITDGINESFQGFMKDAFKCQPGFDDLIQAAREVVASRALFQARKKYMMRVVNLDGYDCDKFKAVGSEIKKSDTPKIIQKVLREIVDLILEGKSYDEVSKFVNENRRKLFKEKLTEENILQFGTSKSANNIEKFTLAYDAEKTRNPLIKESIKDSSGNIIKEFTCKVTIPGHVRAAINYNKLVEEYEGAEGLLIGSGEKVKVFELKSNAYDFTTIGVPSDLVHFPSWFKEHFAINLKTTEEKLIDMKLKGIFAAINEEVPTPFLFKAKSVLQF